MLYFEVGLVLPVAVVLLLVLAIFMFDVALLDIWPSRAASGKWWICSESMWPRSWCLKWPPIPGYSMEGESRELRGAVFRCSWFHDYFRIASAQ